MKNKIYILSRSSHLLIEIKEILNRETFQLILDDIDKVCKSDIVILDIDTFGIGNLSKLRDNCFVIVLTSEKGSRYFIESMTFGAFDCLTKPLDHKKLKQTISKAIGIIDEISEQKTDFNVSVEGEGITCAIVGDSQMLQDVCKMIGEVGRVDVPVLLTGETGTGKDLVAESIWKVSTRWEKQFIVLNCAAIPETLLEAELFGYEKGAFTGADISRVGKFEEADGGVIFLDEIGDMSLSLQAKVLRVIQNGTFHRLGGNKQIKTDIRIIAATNKKLNDLVKIGKFREDLYFRINVVNIHLPSLKERMEDIPLLIQCFTNRHSINSGKAINGATKKFIDKAMNYDWPGNVRELENSIRRAIALSKSNYLTSYDLELNQEFSNGLQNLDNSFEAQLRNSFKNQLTNNNSTKIFNSIVNQIERMVIEEALNLNNWNQSKTARSLGINRLTLRRKILDLNIELKQ